MGVGATFPTKNDIFSMTNPAVTETLWNEISRVIMATQRGLGGDVGDLAEAWNSKQTDIKGIIKNRMAVDGGTIQLTKVAREYATIDVPEIIAVTFTAGVFAGFQKEDIRIFCPMFCQPPYDDTPPGGGGGVGGRINQSCVGSITTTGSIGTDIVVTGFSFMSSARWGQRLDSAIDPPPIWWFAVAGGNDGSGENGSKAHYPTEGWDYW